MFFSITLPYMLFVTTPYLITAFVGNINNFNVIFLLTRGGPLVTEYYQAGKTDLLVTWLYRLTVDRQDYSLASTIGIFVFLISAGLSLIVFNLSGSSRREEEFQ
jgi:arabinogalactan oligomer/maltooligosaccharide transport system permease protein